MIFKNGTKAKLGLKRCINENNTAEISNATNLLTPPSSIRPKMKPRPITSSVTATKNKAKDSTTTKWEKTRPLPLPQPPTIKTSQNQLHTRTRQTKLRSAGFCPIPSKTSPSPKRKLPEAQHHTSGNKPTGQHQDFIQHH